MRGRRRFALPGGIAVLAGAALLASACEDRGSAARPDRTEGPASATPAAEVVAPSTTVRAIDYDPRFFDGSSYVVDNRWFPLTPGTRFVYRGSTVEGNTREHHRVVFTVTDLTKVVDGVRSIVVWDRDYTNGELVEAEVAMFAQDVAGNVWHFGQYPEEYEDGTFDKAPAWVAGFEGARAGIAMKAEPEPGTPSYAQGYAPPPINWVDRARTHRIGERTCVPYGCFDDVLITEEFERTKPGAFQLKFYAPGVGNVRVGWRGRNEKERETLVLVDVVRLDGDALAKARERALELDAHGYERAPGSWGQTPPAEPGPG